MVSLVEAALGNGQIRLELLHVLCLVCRGSETVNIMITVRLCYLYIYRVSKKKVGSRNIIVFHELLGLGCINFKNLCAHHQEEVLRFPKHPQLVKFGWFWAKL